MSIFSGSRYNSVKEYTPVVNRPDGKVRNFLHNRKVFSIDEVKENFTRYEVVNGDLIDKIAYEFYGDETLWWLIADVNNIDYAWDLRPGQILTIPPETILQVKNG